MDQLCATAACRHLAFLGSQSEHLRNLEVCILGHDAGFLELLLLALKDLRIKQSVTVTVHDASPGAAVHDPLEHLSRAVRGALARKGGPSPSVTSFAVAFPAPSTLRAELRVDLGTSSGWAFSAPPPTGSASILAASAAWLDGQGSAAARSAVLGGCCGALGPGGAALFFSSASPFWHAHAHVDRLVRQADGSGDSGGGGGGSSKSWWCVQSEQEVRHALWRAGFAHAEVAANAPGTVAGGGSLVVALKDPVPASLSPGGGRPPKKAKPSRTPPSGGASSELPGPSAALQFFDPRPTYLEAGSVLLPALKPADADRLREKRVEYFAGRVGQFQGTKHEAAARLLGEMDFLNGQLAARGSAVCVVDEPVLALGDAATEIPTPEAAVQVTQLLELLKPFKKGPLRLFGTDIDTEWRSDWKWDRLRPQLPDLAGKAVCDVGCANGYFMFRMLEQAPRCVVGIDPNLKAWLEFQALKRFAGPRAKDLHFEVLDACECHFPACFDVVFCLGVLYHVTDPISMLRSLWKSMAPRATLIVDCQGIPDAWGEPAPMSAAAEAAAGSGMGVGGISSSAAAASSAVASSAAESIASSTAGSAGSQPLALVPRGKYANAGGMWFLPNRRALVHWLERANFRDVKVFYAEKLSVEEQRTTGWADIPSLAQSLDKADPTLTVEGYPAPFRYYLRATRG